MIRAAKALAAVAVVLALTGADGGCRVQTNRTPDDRAHVPAYAAVITVDGSGPYRVRYRTAEVGTIRGDWTRWLPIAGGEYTANVTYGPQAPAIDIIVEARAAAEDLVTCRIEDGPDNVYERGALGYVQCGLITNRSSG